MLKRKIIIDPKARIAHMPKHLIEQGFEGACDAYTGVVTLTIVPPDTPTIDIITSLEIVIDSIRLQQKRSQN